MLCLAWFQNQRSNWLWIRVSDPFRPSLQVPEGLNPLSSTAETFFSKIPLGEYCRRNIPGACGVRRKSPLPNLVSNFWLEFLFFKNMAPGGKFVLVGARCNVPLPGRKNHEALPSAT